MDSSRGINQYNCWPLRQSEVAEPMLCLVNKWVLLVVSKSPRKGKRWTNRTCLIDSNGARFFQGKIGRVSLARMASWLGNWDRDGYQFLAFSVTEKYPSKSGRVIRPPLGAWRESLGPNNSRLNERAHFLVRNLRAQNHSNKHIEQPPASMPGKHGRKTVVISVGERESLGSRKRPGKHGRKTVVISIGERE